jgi:hypothetical protein
MQLTYKIKDDALDKTLYLYDKENLIGEFIYSGNPQDYVRDMQFAYDMGCQITADQYKDKLAKLQKFQEATRIERQKQDYSTRVEEHNKRELREEEEKRRYEEHVDYEMMDSMSYGPSSVRD